MPYVIKLSNGKLGTSAYIYEKHWSNEMLSNTVSEINNKDFMFKFRAKRWAKKELIKTMLFKQEMEIIDGRG